MGLAGKTILCHKFQLGQEGLMFKVIAPLLDAIVPIVQFTGMVALGIFCQPSRGASYIGPLTCHIQKTRIEEKISVPDAPTACICHQADWGYLQIDQDILHVVGNTWLY
jgi:hypothetical protein